MSVWFRVAGRTNGADYDTKSPYRKIRRYNVLQVQINTFHTRSSLKFKSYFFIISFENELWVFITAAYFKH